MISPKPPATPAARYAHLETQLGNVATQLADFIRDSKEYRDRIERDQLQIWSAIKEQGENLQRSVERLSANGRISWPMIVATVGMVLSVSAGAAAIGNTLMESRIRQTDIRLEYIVKEQDRHREMVDRLHPMPGRE